MPNENIDDFLCDFGKETERKDQVTFGDITYHINVIEGNHGGWLFVQRGKGFTIWEQSGYKDWDKAISDGKLYAEFDYKNYVKKEKKNV